MIDFEKDAEALKLQDDDIEGIAALAKRAKELEILIFAMSVVEKS